MPCFSKSSAIEFAALGVCLKTTSLKNLDRTSILLATILEDENERKKFYLPHNPSKRITGVNFVNIGAWKLSIFIVGR
jgi:hypothetical protein